MNYRKIAAFLLGTSLLAGCEPSLPGLRPLTYATPGEARLFVAGGRCVHSPTSTEAAGLIAAGLVQAGSLLLKNFGQALKDGSQGGALQPVVATENIQLDPGASPRCVTLVRGTFDDTGEVKDSVSVATFLNISETEATFQALNIPKVTTLDYYIEVELANSTNHKALKFMPVYALVNRSIDGDRKGTRDLSIALAFSKIGASDVGSTVVLGNQTIGTGKKFETNTGRYVHESPWFGAFNAKPDDPSSSAQSPDLNALSNANPATPPPPSGTASPVGTGGAFGSGGETTGGTPAPAVANISATGKDAVPITVKMTVVETRPTKEGLAFIASIFNGIEPQIETAAKPLLDSKAADAATTTDLTALATYATAKGSAEANLITYCNASSTDATAAGKQDRISKSATARAAQLQANVAAIGSGQPKPYLAFVAISSDLPGTANGTICKQH